MRVMASGRTTPVSPNPDDKVAHNSRMGRAKVNSQTRCPAVRTTDASPTPSPARSRPQTPTGDSDPNFQNYNSASDLQARYGTGPLPGLSSTRKPAPPSPVSEKSEDEASIYEYRGVQLTGSALSLVQRQERLALADSSGQYTGDVSWDDLRQAWIPAWAQKLRAGDLAEGELPNTNPADYKVRRKDAWGNKIGWSGGRM